MANPNPNPHPHPHPHPNPNTNTNQGPDGGISASRYSFLGGFDGTTNALAGHMCEVPLHGTMAHAFIQSFSDRSDLATTTLVGPPPSKASVRLRVRVRVRVR